MSHPVLLNPSAVSAPSSWRVPGGWLRRVPAWLLVAGASLPVAVWFVRRLDDGGDEPFGLLPLVLALALAWRDRAALRTDARAAVAGACLLLVSVLAIGTLPPLLRATLAVGGAGCWFGLHRRPGLLGLLALSLPVVESLQFFAGYPMRVAAAAGAVNLLELAGIVVTRQGVQLILGGVPVAVDPACGGIRMLWHALVAAMALAGIHRVSWPVTLAGGLLAVALVIPANTVRATWLALEESGRIAASGLGHGTVGLVCFSVVLIPLWWFLARRARLSSRMPAGLDPGTAARAILAASALLAPFKMASTEPRQTMPAMAVFPATFTFNGLTLPLERLPASPEEAAFGASFPGALASFRWGGCQVIQRRVTQATRRLHPSADCLRAAGFTTGDAFTVRCPDGSQWSRFSATRDGLRLTVHERIVSETNGATWTDVSAWYWSALRRPLNGPWRAETVISG